MPSASASSRCIRCLVQTSRKFAGSVSTPRHASGAQCSSEAISKPCTSFAAPCREWQSPGTMLLCRLLVSRISLLSCILQCCCAALRQHHVNADKLTMQESEPEIWNAIKFGSILENVVFDEYTREVDFMSKYALPLIALFACCQFLRPFQQCPLSVRHTTLAALSPQQASPRPVHCSSAFEANSPACCMLSALVVTAVSPNSRLLMASPCAAALLSKVNLSER